MKKVIKVGFCVSYDWELMKISLPLVYEAADIICLSIDKYRKSWAGQPYEFDEAAFKSFIRDIDVSNKIRILEAVFSSSLNSSRENCNLQRREMAEFLGVDGWHLQIDADEYFVDFQDFVGYLKKLNPEPHFNQKPINICCPLFPLIRRVKKGVLFVDYDGKSPEYAPVATNLPEYQRARHNGHFNHLTNFWLIHETWAREEDALKFKINNWGHSSEELKQKEIRDSYYQLWKVMDENNFQYIFNFHPAKREVWPKLGYLPSGNISELINFLKESSNFNLENNLRLKNNRNLARIRVLLDKMSKKK